MVIWKWIKWAYTKFYEQREFEKRNFDCTQTLNLGVKILLPLKYVFLYLEVQYFNIPIPRPVSTYLGLIRWEQAKNMDNRPYIFSIFWQPVRKEYVHTKILDYTYRLKIHTFGNCFGRYFSLKYISVHSSGIEDFYKLIKKKFLI